jgi:hypothetical protein
MKKGSGGQTLLLGGTTVDGNVFRPIISLKQICDCQAGGGKTGQKGQKFEECSHEKDLLVYGRPSIVGPEFYLV